MEPHDESPSPWLKSAALFGRDGTGGRAPAAVAVNLVAPIRNDLPAAGGQPGGVSSHRGVSDPDNRSRAGGRDSDAVVSRRRIADHHFDRGAAGILGNNAGADISGRDAVAHRRHNGRAGIVGTESDTAARAIFHPNALEHGPRGGSTRGTDHDAVGTLLLDGRIRDIELAGAGGWRLANSLEASTDDAAMHMQRRAGGEEDAKTGAAAHIDRQSAQRNNRAGIRIDDDARPIGGRVD